MENVGLILSCLNIQLGSIEQQSAQYEIVQFQSLQMEDSAVHMHCKEDCPLGYVSRNQ